MAIYIKGDNVANAETYQLFLKEGGEWTPVKTSKSGINFNVSELGLPAGTYEFAVKAYAVDYEPSNFSNVLPIKLGDDGSVEVPETPTTYYTITYKYMFASTSIKAQTTEQVAAGTTKVFSASDSRAQVSGYTCTSVSPSGTQIINGNIEVVYSYAAESSTKTEIVDYIVDQWACWNDGRESALSGYYCVVDYPVKPNTTYSIPYARNWFCENGSQVFLVGGGNGGAATGNTITTPATTAYLTVCFKPDDIAMNAVTITEVTSGGGTSGGGSSNPDASATTTAYGGVVMPGYMVNTSGALSTMSTTTAIDMIPVQPSKTYRMYGCRNTALLNSSGSVIKAISGGNFADGDYTFTTTSDTTHVRTCYYWTSSDYPTLTAETFTLEEIS